MNEFSEQLASERRGNVPVMALRPDSRFPEELDDVVVKDVTMFRAEAMADDDWWMACYFPNGERIAFQIRIDKKSKRVSMTTTEYPPEWIDMDKDKQ